MKIIFGPVPSRRLGSSLGVDLTPRKTCNMDCVYCECGKTTNLSNKREKFYKLEEVLSELDDAVNNRGPIDYITLSGSGEPALYSELKELVTTIKKRYPSIKFAILTNTSLITDPDVFAAFLEADIVLPSVDSVLNDGFQKVNRPHPDLDLSKILESLLDFRKVFKGQIWMEIFICPGLNDSEKELSALSAYVKKLNPHRVQINTLDRPGAEPWVKPLDADGLDRVLSFFKGINVETISRKLIKSMQPKTQDDNDSDNLLISTLRRRPMTKKDIMALSGWTESKAQSWIESSLDTGLLSSTESANGEKFFSLNIST